ncbi:MAG: hypothetical protein K2W95_24595 [Candidatus Obscuribacterales bacterium]|nr:hypothetical protein [Candidatus Obscuribacterales bacterium]
MEILYFSDPIAGGFSELLQLDSSPVESIDSGERVNEDCAESLAPQSLEQSLLAFADALDDCDLELFVNAWKRAGIIAKLQFEKEGGEQRMHEAFGVSYLRTLLAC